MNYSIVTYTLGIVLHIEAAGMMLPLVCALCYREMKSAAVFLICIALCAAIGAVLKIKKPNVGNRYSTC